MEWIDGRSSDRSRARHGGRQTRPNSRKSPPAGVTGSPRRDEPDSLDHFSASIWGTAGPAKLT